MERIPLQQTVRAVLALCQLAARCDADDIRTDITDEAAALIDVTIGLPADARFDAVAVWCRQTVGWLERLKGTGGIDEPALLRALARVLRLQAASDEQPQKKIEQRARAKRREPAVEVAGEPTAGQQRIVEWLKANPGVRNRALVAHFTGEISPRTVKRILTKLLAMGLVRRSELATGGVSYEAVER